MKIGQEEIHTMLCPLCLKVHKSLPCIMMPSGNPWIENWDEKSAHEGFLTGVRFACEQAVKRITAICKA